MTENSEVIAREGLLPLGVALGCRLVRPVPKDAPLSYSDVEVPPGRVVDALYAEQAERFPLTEPALIGGSR